MRNAEKQMKCFSPQFYIQFYVLYLSFEEKTLIIEPIQLQLVKMMNCNFQVCLILMEKFCLQGHGKGNSMENHIIWRAIRSHLNRKAISAGTQQNSSMGSVISAYLGRAANWQLPFVLHSIRPARHARRVSFGHIYDS